ncbi:hypothetical protein HAX54_010431 [Datura stramonium]|uniref:Uncharacterized protein n=1 Tax=Datura stramonium TaxID=4076 RepID=A0ABS8TI43_DATST|nr:hypothetical protein [Datura stramonium]
MEEHGLKWFNSQKEANYASENWIYDGCLALEFPTISDTIRVLGLVYVFAELEECNLTLVKEFYTNWNTSHRESTKNKVQGQVVRFTARTSDSPVGESCGYDVYPKATDLERRFIGISQPHPPFADGFLVSRKH